MPLEIVECAEFAEVQISISKLMRDGEIHLDERVIGRGYFNVSLRDGQIILRADRHVGLIPLNSTIAVRVKPRASIRNLSQMLVGSGITPFAIADFERGYVPRFESGKDAEKLYAKSLLSGVERVLSRGLVKSYSTAINPPAWRGRLLASETIKRHRARGIRFRHEFEVSTLSVACVENIALKKAVRQVYRWISLAIPRDASRRKAESLLHELRNVPDWEGETAQLVAELARRAGLLPPHLAYYRDALWTAFVLLQSKVPEMERDGSVRLDSLIVDVSKIFEAFTRNVIAERAAKRGWTVTDGNLRPSPLFTDHNAYTVRPDIVISDGQKPLAVLDAKYKPDPKESDRYEVIAFMDALGVSHGGFINPQRDGARSSNIGTTLCKKHLSVLRFDLAAQSLEDEADRLFDNIVELVQGTHQFK